MQFYHDAAWRGPTALHLEALQLSKPCFNRVEAFMCIIVVVCQKVANRDAASQTTKHHACELQ